MVFYQTHQCHHTNFRESEKAILNRKVLFSIVNINTWCLYTDSWYVACIFFAGDLCSVVSNSLLHMVTLQAPLCPCVSRQAYWVGCQFLFQDLPNQWSTCMSCASCIGRGILYSVPSGKVVFWSCSKQTLLPRMTKQINCIEVTRT